MPDRDWPPAQRRLARILRAAMYVFAVIAGAAVLAGPPVAGGPVDPIWAVGLSLTAVAAGTAAAIGVVVRSWHVEWVAAPLVATPFAGYAILEAASGDPAVGAALAVAGTACAARAVDLWVFSLTAGRIRQARVRKWRRVAGLEQ